MAIVNVVGAGLAGCEAAYRLSKEGINVRLFEMKPEKYSPAHKSEGFSELVCSNSFKAINVDSASGLLKEEMRLLDSISIDAAYKSKVPAGQALAVDRNIFSDIITEKIKALPNVQIIYGEVKTVSELPEADGIIIATGPLTADSLAEDIKKLTGEEAMSFFDAAAPVVYYDSIDQDLVFRAARYGKGTDDYVNCPMTKDEYYDFYNALITAETAEVHGFDDLKLYEGCMPVESMAKRGPDTLKFGPLKPVGLTKPDGTRPYAVVQLRQDNESGTLYNIVGFQTRLKFSEQKRVFGMIPGLKNAEYARYGVMHRNTYLHSPGKLDANFGLLKCEKTPIWFAGQITGVEGYMESASSGIVAAIACARKLKGLPEVFFPTGTMIGALASYTANFAGKDFQPMGANFGIVDTGTLFETRVKDKALKKQMTADYALSSMKKFIEETL